MIMTMESIHRGSAFWREEKGERRTQQWMGTNESLTKDSAYREGLLELKVYHNI